jgi:uncharacterized protein
LKASSFLTAEWRHLAMLNYEIDPRALRARVPPGTELDSWNGRTFVSMVGFRFLNTRLLGVPVPFHRDFEEVNLRFYVRRKNEEGWRRGVVFVKEIVPRWAIAAVARLCYGERYAALPMRHQLDLAGDPTTGDGAARYEWSWRGEWNQLSLRSTGQAALPERGSQAEFITEHYWGYAHQRSRATVEYRVEHPPWRVWQVSEATLRCDVRSLYGPEFVEGLSGKCSSAFLADGSAVTVYRGARL